MIIILTPQATDENLKELVPVSETALKNGAQSLRRETFAQLMVELKAVARAVDRYI